MCLDEAEREIFDAITQKYIDRIGMENLETVYAMHREMTSKLQLKHFPIIALRNYILFRQMKDAGISKLKDAKLFLKEHNLDRIKEIDKLFEDYKSFLQRNKKLKTKVKNEIRPGRFTRNL